MSSDNPAIEKEVIQSHFWQEVAETDNPFAAAICRCAGYDVYGDLLGKVSWIEYLYLLFHGEQPNPQQAQLLNALAVALANPGPRDCSVQAAMSAGAGGSTLASSLMAALAVGAGNLGGAREVYETMILWEKCSRQLLSWKDALSQWRNTDRQPEAMTSVWPSLEHPPGYDPNGLSCTTPVRKTLEYLAQFECSCNLRWLREQRGQLEEFAQLPLAFSGIAAAALTDLKFDPQQGEMLYLLLRLPGAAAHALEQNWLGCQTFPFFRQGINLTNDPGPAAAKSGSDVCPGSAPSKRL